MLFYAFIAVRLLNVNPKKQKRLQHIFKAQTKEAEEKKNTLNDCVRVLHIDFAFYSCCTFTALFFHFFPYILYEFYTFLSLS